MQGQKSSFSSLPENLSFDHGSSSIDGAIDSQISWNSLQTSAQNGLPDCRMLSSDTNISYLHRPRHEWQNSEWNIGETSYRAAQNQGDENERKAEHTSSICSRAALTLEEQQYEPSNILSLDNVDAHLNGNRTANGSFLLPSASSDTLHQDLNMNLGLGDLEDDCQVIEGPNTYKSIDSSTEKMPYAGSSSNSFAVNSGLGGYLIEGNDDRSGYSLDGRRLSCKRKALEVHTGQSSGVGSSNCFHHVERRPWHAVPAAQNSVSSFGWSTQAVSNVVMNNGSQQENSRIRLGVGRDLSASPFSLTASGAAESSRRNFRLRFDGSHQQDPLPGNPLSAQADVGQIHFSSSQNPSSSRLDNSLLDFIPAPAADNGSLHGQSALLQVPSVHRNHQSRWNGGVSSSRTISSSTSAFSGDRDSVLCEEPTARNIPRSISEHPIFVPACETRSSSRQPTNWNFTEGNNNIAGNTASTSRVGSSLNVPQYPQRLSEIVRRSLLSTMGAESGSQSSNHALRSSSSATLALSSGSGNRGHQLSNARSTLLERHLDGAFGIPYSLRTLAAASEGRSSVMSEIRHVLDLMRRGEGLRFEDVMILDHSIFFGMTDIHDRHRDMRLDVDNMSYEELLALEERIGNVCTGLSEETIMSRLKQRIYVNNRAIDQTEMELCSICREEYNDGEYLGKLECGHDFHKACIKQWLVLKNLCPICKTTGLTT